MRLLKEKQYAIYAGACVSVLQIIAQLVEHTGDNNLLFGISVGAFVVNFIAALWAFSVTRVTQQDSWKILVYNTVFYFTGILAPYSAVSVFLPQKFAWYPFAAICMIITLFKCYSMLKANLTLAYEKVADATRWVLSNMTQLSADDAPALPPLDV